MADQVQDQIAADELARFERPLSVSVMAKLKQWPMLQSLGFQGALKDAKEMFHGLKDFNLQMTKYSGTDYKLQLAWNVIKQIAPVNPEVAAAMFAAPSLGEVGRLFASIHGFGQVFSLAPDVLKTPAAAGAKIKSAAALLTT